MRRTRPYYRRHNRLRIRIYLFILRVIILLFLFYLASLP